MAKKNGKKYITILLVLSCVVSGIILASSPAYKTKSLRSFSTLDSLINLKLEDARILPAHIRPYTIRIDSSFERKVYRVKVPSRFSKTRFHLNLHDALLPYGIESPAKVTLPAHDMDIYVYEENTIFRTIRLQTDSSIDSLYYTEE
ncbi:MAG: hypothetical protein FH748_09310 [Balneolaceae bacterium]|nr:hypothetical protein [Balneolaceae bacterium]